MEDCLKHFRSRHRAKNNVEPTKEDEDRERIRLLREYEFEPTWFPPEWLA